MKLPALKKPEASEAGQGVRGRRWVVVHDSSRDQYQIPIALAESGILEQFVTDWYTPLDQPLWSWFAKSKLGKFARGIRSRYRVDLPSSLVSDRKARFLTGLFCRKISRVPYRDEVEGSKTGRLAATIANRRDAALLATSYSGAAAFSYLRKGLPRVLFQVHPHPRFLRQLYVHWMGRDSDYAGLKAEPESSVHENDLRVWERESLDADFVLCASQFTKRSLVESGVDSSRIEVLPYGVNADLFSFGRPQADAPFTALYVGQKVARKSLRMLLTVWRDLNLSNARLIVAGGHVRDASLLRDFEDVYEEIPRSDLASLVRLYQNADVFVLPSVAEGFGHVYLEALSCGTPIICTDNTGGPDIIREGESGWVLAAGDRNALRDRIGWCRDNLREVRTMREGARAAAEKLTWSRFRNGIREILGHAEFQAQHRGTSAEAYHQQEYAEPRIVGGR